MVNQLQFTTHSPAQTKAVARVLAREILKTKAQKALVLALKGNLGAGKTTFLQTLAKSLGVKDQILSPTFVILKKFEIENPKTQFLHFYHIDCYRLEESKEIFTLGFKEIIKNPNNIVAIEWAENIKGALPKERITLEFKHLGKNQREVIIK